MNKLINGDTIEILKNASDSSVDLIVTDPPYPTIGGGNKSEKWKSGYKTSILKDNEGKGGLKHNNIKIEDYIGEFYRVMKPGTHLYIMTNNINLKKFMIEIEKVGFKFHNFLVWEKKSCNTNRWYLRNTEYILFYRKPPAKTINNPSSKPIFRFDTETFINDHPNKKPYELYELLIKNSSNEGEVVLDPFMGSGVGGVACKNLNRDFIGIELDEKYFNIAKKSIENNLITY